jgi:hypothetical protein
MLGQHSYYLQGSLSIGRDFLYNQYASLAKNLIKQQPDSPHVLPALVCAARLAPRLRSTAGFRASVWHYRRALRRTSIPAIEVALIYEIANRHALQRQPDKLAQARKLYTRGYTALQRISDSEERIRAEINLDNGLALVEYHEGHNEQALALERHAQSVATQVAAEYPHLERWATLLLNTNMAKLMEKRFFDVPSPPAHMILDAYSKYSLR